MSEKIEYLVRAHPKRKRQGGAWTPKNSEDCGFWASLNWHLVELDQAHAEAIANSHMLEIHLLKPEKMYKEHPSKEKGYKKSELEKNTAWSVPQNTVRRKATDSLFDTEPDDDLVESGVEPRRIDTSDEDPEEEVPDSVKEILDS